MKVLEFTSGVLALVSGSGFLFLWYRDKKYPSQRTRGIGLLMIGALLLLDCVRSFFR